VHLTFDHLAIVVFTFVQWRIGRMLVAAAGRRWQGLALAAARWTVGVFTVAVAVGYALAWPYAATVLRVSGPHATLAGALAMGYLIVATGALAVYEISRGIGRTWNAPADPGRRRLIQTTGNALMAAPLAVMGYGTFVERSDFRVREVDVPLADLPADLDGLRVLQLSDIHLSIFLREDELARVIGQSNELKPQLAVVTGDLISANGDPLDACLRQLKRLRADAGIFGCLGNHERFAGVEDYTTRAAARRESTFCATAPGRSVSAGRLSTWLVWTISAWAKKTSICAMPVRWSSRGLAIYCSPTIRTCCRWRRAKAGTSCSPATLTAAR